LLNTVVYYCSWRVVLATNVEESFHGVSLQKKGY